MPPYRFASRRESTSRLTPLRTAIRTGATLSGDQRVERRAHLVRRQLDAEARLPQLLQKNEPRPAVDGLLVARHRSPGEVAIDLHRTWLQLLLDRLRVEAGEAQRGEQAEGDGAAVRKLEARGDLERVRKRVAEVELRPLAAVVRVAQAD